MQKQDVLVRLKRREDGRTAMICTTLGKTEELEAVAVVDTVREEHIPVLWTGTDGDRVLVSGANQTPTSE